MKCTKCKYFRYSQVSGSPFNHKWKCTKQDGKWFQRNGQSETNESSLECFEPREIPFWRFPLAVVVGFWITIVLFIVIYFLGVGFHLASIGDFRPVSVVVPIIVGIVSIGVGIFGSIEWYKLRL